MGKKGFFLWEGDFYAQALIERLGLFDSGRGRAVGAGALQYGRGSRPLSIRVGGGGSGAFLTPNASERDTLKGSVSSCRHKAGALSQGR